MCCSTEYNSSTDMNNILTLQWDNPTPHPNCGYIASYRRKGDSSYTSISTSGSTSGTTSLVVHTSGPANYEGYIQSNCCSDNLSLGDGWAVNTYEPVGVVVSVKTSPLRYAATITSQFANPYDTIITGNYTSSAHGVSTYSATYPAGSTSAVVTISGTPASAAETISNTTVGDISPIFNNGGELQQYDAVLTPTYFQYTATSGQTSGTTFWQGSPLVLPSFTLDAFNITETDVDGNVIAGDLIVSWANSTLYGSGEYPYSNMQFIIQQNMDSDIVSDVTFPNITRGLHTMTLPMIKTVNNITTTVEYKINIYWENGAQPSVGNVVLFYLPDF